MGKPYSLPKASFTIEMFSVDKIMVKMGFLKIHLMHRSFSKRFEEQHQFTLDFARLLNL